MATDLLEERVARLFTDPTNPERVLEVGACGAFCANIRLALYLLDICVEREGDEFDEHLSQSVRQFQRKEDHRIDDGKVGRGTRGRLARAILYRFKEDLDILLRFQRPEGGEAPIVFISYASADVDPVCKLHQWLVDHGVRVIRDATWFVPGLQIPTNIRNAIVAADKVIAVYSKNSTDRDWPRLERDIVEQLEERLGMPLLIYLNLDDVTLPSHDPNRLAILAQHRSLKDIGEALLHAIQQHHELHHPRYSYDESQPLRE